jgi:hypothetical protein
MIFELEQRADGWYFRWIKGGEPREWRGPFALEGKARQVAVQEALDHVGIYLREI